MGIFTDWLKKEQGIEEPVGLEAARQRVTEAYREFGDGANRQRPQRRQQPKPEQQSAPPANPFADVPGEILDQLRGLVKREPNPAAQQRALQGHVERWRANQAKQAAETPKPASIEARKAAAVGKPAAPEPDPSKLDLSRSAAPKPPEGAGGGGTKPPVGAGGSEPEPEESRQPQFNVPSFSPQFSWQDEGPDFEDAESVIANLEQFLTSNARGSGPQGQAAKIINALQDPARRGRALKWLQTMNQHDSQLREKRQEMMDFDPNDPSQIVKNMVKFLGFRENSRGKLLLPDDHDIVKRIFSADLTEPYQKGGRFLGRQAFRSLFDPEVREALLSDDPRSIQKLVLNRGRNIPSEVADDIFDDLENQTDYQGWARSQGGYKLDPLDYQIEFDRPLNEDGEEEFSGLTNLDLLRESNPEAYRSMFRRDTIGNGRGRHLFHKNLIQFGSDGLTGADELLTPKRGTIDHIIGRTNHGDDEESNEDEIFDVEAPVNLAIAGRGTNQFKNSTGNAFGVTDMPSGLVNFVQRLESGQTELGEADKNGMKYGAPFARALAGLISPDNLDISGEDRESARDKIWLIHRLAKGDFNNPPVSLSEMPDLQTLAGIDLGTADRDQQRLIKKFLDEPSARNPIGQDLANLTTYYPRSDHRNTHMTSWSGNPSDSNNWGAYAPLFPFKTLLGAAASNTNFPGIEQIEDDIRRDVMNSRVVDKEERIQQRIKDYKRAQITQRIVNPLKVRGAAWSTGLIDNETYLQELQRLQNSARDTLDPLDTDLSQILFDRSNSSLEIYGNKVDDNWSSGSVPTVDERWMRGMMKQNPMKLLATSTFGRNLLPPEIRDEFDSEFLTPGGNWRKKIQQGFNPNDPSSFVESELTLNLRPDTML